MSLEAIIWAIERVGNITPTQKLILICLANHAGPDGTCFPSHNLISDYSGLRRETICRNLAILENKGLITSDRKKNEAGREISKKYSGFPKARAKKDSVPRRPMTFEEIRRENNKRSLEEYLSKEENKQVIDAT